MWPQTFGLTKYLRACNTSTLIGGQDWIKFLSAKNSNLMLTSPEDWEYTACFVFFF